MTFPFAPLRMFGYDVIEADPPWDFANYSEKGTGKGADPHYSVMDLDAIKALPVGHLARRDAVLLLWATIPMLPQGLDTMKAWGAEYKSHLIWRKTTKNGKIRWGTGYRAQCGHEIVLLGCFGAAQNHARFPSIFDGLAREHSRKPDEFYQLVVERTLGRDRCSLFTRETRAGFESWGNEATKFDEAAA